MRRFLSEGPVTVLADAGTLPSVLRVLAESTIAHSSLASVLFELLRHRVLRERLNVLEAVKRTDREFIEAILRFTREHLGDPALDSAHLAEHHFISERKLYQLFEARGTTPAGWIRHTRMELAKDLLSRSDAPIAEVGQLVGYPESTSFSRAFSRDVGASPTAFRASLNHQDWRYT